MKKIICLIAGLFQLSCASQLNNKNSTKEYTLSSNEKNIISDFINEEFSSKKYNNYKNYKIYLRRKGFSEFSPLLIYGFCYDERNNKVRTANNKYWILNKEQLKTIKDTLQIKNFTWKETDITNFRVSMIDSEDVNNSIKKGGDYEQYNESLILSLSTPVLINKNNAFLTYLCVEALYGFSTFDFYAVLLKKNKNGKWLIDSYYYDPNSSW